MSRIEQLVDEAVRGGRFNSQRDFALKAGLSGSYFAENRKRREAGKKPTTLTVDTLLKISELLGVPIGDLVDQAPKGSTGDKYPGRARAVVAARNLGLPEAAIQVVLDEDPGRDPGVMYWFRRMESEAERVRPAAER